MTRVSAVIDTNLFVSGTIIRRGSPYQVLEFFAAGKCDLLLSPEQKREIRQVFTRPHIVEHYRISATEIEHLFTVLDTAISIDISGAHVPVEVRDPNDKMILATAVVGNAHYLVTGDHDLLVLADHPLLGSLRIVTAAAFVDVLRNLST